VDRNSLICPLLAELDYTVDDKPREPSRWTPVNSGHHRPTFFLARRICQRRRKLLSSTLSRSFVSESDDDRISVVKSHTFRREHQDDLVQRRRHRSNELERLHGTFISPRPPAPPWRSPSPYGRARELYLPRDRPDPPEVRVRLPCGSYLR
jgi:hypothetical protein